jgi:hypothetical protein
VELTGPPPPVKLIGIGVGEEVLIPMQRWSNIIIDRCSKVENYSGASGDASKDLRERKRKF